jgi:hypothetical protein
MKKKERVQTGRCRRAFRKEGRGEHSDRRVQRRTFRQEGGGEHSDRSGEESI